MSSKDLWCLVHQTTLGQTALRHMYLGRNGAMLGQKPSENTSFDWKITDQMLLVFTENEVAWVRKSEIITRQPNVPKLWSVGF